MSLPTLIFLSYSPWSEQARWALEARGIAYKRQRYEPLLGEPALRRTTGIWRGPVSVPVLVADREVLTDSWDIARWAAQRGDGADLLPDVDAVTHWQKRAQHGLAAGRALSLVRLADDATALTELTPRPLRPLGALSRAVTRLGVQRTRRKYGANATSHAAHDAAFREVLGELRDALGGDLERCVLGEFSYADITAAQVLTFVQPHVGEFLRVGPGTRRTYGNGQLAEEYSDLLKWRDELYTRHRTRPA